MITVILEFERSTPGAHRYSEINREGKPVSPVDAYIGTQYFRKKMFPDGPPSRVSVTVEGID